VGSACLSRGRTHTLGRGASVLPTQSNAWQRRHDRDGAVAASSPGTDDPMVSPRSSPITLLRLDEVDTYMQGPLSGCCSVAAL
jgi:hypothetical protein